MKSIKKPKSKVRIKVSKGKLLGYHVTDPLKMRRSILKKIVKDMPYDKLIKRLNVLSIYNKNRHPEISQKIKRDISFLRKTPIKKKSKVRKTPIKKKSKVRKTSTKKRSLRKTPVKKRKTPIKKKSKVKIGGRCGKCMCRKRFCELDCNRYYNKDNKY